MIDIYDTSKCHRGKGVQWLRTINRAMEDGVLRGLFEEEPAMYRRRVDKVFQEGKAASSKVTWWKGPWPVKGRKGRRWVWRESWVELPRAPRSCWGVWILTSSTEGNMRRWYLGKSHNLMKSFAGFKNNVALRTMWALRTFSQNTNKNVRWQLGR